LLTGAACLLLRPTQVLETLKDPLLMLFPGRARGGVFAVLCNFPWLATRYPRRCARGGGQCLLRLVACCLGVSCVSDAWRGCPMPWHASAEARHGGGSRNGGALGSNVCCTSVPCCSSTRSSSAAMKTLHTSRPQGVRDHVSAICNPCCTLSCARHATRNIDRKSVV